MIWILICVGFSLSVMGHIMNDNDWAFIPGLSGLCLLLGIMFYVMITIAHAECGIASVYDTRTGTRTASGQILHNNGLTAAHLHRPFGSQVTVKNMSNGKTVTVTINDRGPAAYLHRIIDLTPAGARVLGFSGLARVCLN